MHKRLSVAVVALLILAVSLPGCFSSGGGGGKSSISGVIRDGDTREPIEGALVKMSGAVGRSLSDGSFVLSGLPVGAHTLEVSASGYELWSDVVYLSDGANDAGTIYLYPDDGWVQDAVADLRMSETLVIVPYNTGAEASTSSYTISLQSEGTPPASSVATRYGTGTGGRASVFAAKRVDISAMSEMDRRLRELEESLAGVARFDPGYDRNWRDSQRSKIGAFYTGSPGYSVGDSESFWVRKDFYTISEQDWTEISATLKSEGDHVYIFVDDQTSLVSSDKANQLKQAFDGFYSEMVSIFGSENNPGIDGDSKVFVLITPLVNQLGVGGFYDALNEFSQEVIDQLEIQTGETLHTNEKNMIFLSTPFSASDSGWLDWSKGAIAHEFQHMIHFYQRTVVTGVESETWLNEGMAVLAEDLAGYGYHNGSNTAYVSDYLSDPGEFSVVFWAANGFVDYGDYGAPYLFMRYLVDKYGTGIVSRILADTRPPIQGVEAAVGKPFEQIFSEWARALYIDDTPFERDFSGLSNFDSLDLRSIQADGTSLNGPRAQVMEMSGQRSDSAVPWAAGYIEVSVSSDERVHIGLSSSDPTWAFDHFVHDGW